MRHAALTATPLPRRIAPRGTTGVIKLARHRRMPDSSGGPPMPRVLKPLLASRLANRSGSASVQPEIEVADDSAVDVELLGGSQPVLVLHAPDEEAFEHFREVRDGQALLVGRSAAPARRTGSRRRPRGSWSRRCGTPSNPSAARGGGASSWRSRPARLPRTSGLQRNARSPPPRRWRATRPFSS